MCIEYIIEIGSTRVKPTWVQSLVLFILNINKTIIYNLHLWFLKRWNSFRWFPEDHFLNIFQRILYITRFKISKDHLSKISSQIVSRRSFPFCSQRSLVSWIASKNFWIQRSLPEDCFPNIFQRIFVHKPNSKISSQRPFIKDLFPDRFWLSLNGCNINWCFTA